MYRAGTWFLARSHQAKGQLPTRVVRFGQAGDVPVVGDWDGDGRDSPGLFRAGTWTLNPDVGDAATSVQLRFGAAADHPVVGDWDGTGPDTIGVYREGTWLLPTGNDALDAELALLVLGTRDTVPVVGDWDARTGDTVGVVR